MEQQDLYTEYRKHLKERILTVAMQAFKQHGIRNVRMDDIATTLAISKRTIYETYSNKEELLLDGIMREDKERKRDAQRYAADETHNVMDIVCYIYNRDMAEMASPSLTGKIIFHKFSRYFV